MRPATKIRSVLAVLTMSLGLVAVVAAPAHAEPWPLYDGFEGNRPHDRWQVEFPTLDGQFRGIRTDGTQARTGSNNAYLSGGPVTWSDGRVSIASVGRSVDLDVPAGNIYWLCTASIYMRSVNPYSRDPVVNFEIIDRATWSYAALNTATVRLGDYVRFRAGPWVLRDHPSVFVRMSLISDERDGGTQQVHIDDLSIGCTTIR